MDLFSIGSHALSLLKRSGGVEGIEVLSPMRDDAQKKDGARLHVSSMRSTENRTNALLVLRALKSEKGSE